jgi:hypothetical protein
LNRAGLTWYSLIASDLPGLRARLNAADVPLTTIATGLETADPWGTPLRIRSSG